ncbi:MAG: cyclic nucleotide-binding domain-containing protein [Clostridiales bacterium]|nr:cyclic nucleotide-binding domain-containing protein [Clostridiales bacterium]
MKTLDMDQKCYDLLAGYGLGGLDLPGARCFIFEQGEYLFREGEDVHYVHFVLSGKAKVYLGTSNGKQLLLCYFISDGLLGSLELLSGKRVYPVTAQAVSEFVCVGLPLHIYTEVLRNNILFMNRIGTELAESLYMANRNAAAMILLPLEARLYAYITQTALNGLFRETLTELADFLGTSYRHLLRGFHKLCAEGILQKEYGGYRVIRPQVLHEKAGEIYTLQYKL